MKSQCFNSIKEDKKTAKDTAEIAKLDIKKAAEKSHYPCIIHFDGKTLFEINQG